jgi:ankyrin repeat protein
MAYPLFHQIHLELEDGGHEIKPAFYDTDGSPVYEDPYGGLLSHIVAQNDVAALRLYQDSPHTKVFWEAYEVPSWHPFFVAAKSSSLDALRELLEIYLADPMYHTEPLDQYLERLRFSPINVACAAAHRELTLWLLHHGTPPLARLHDRNTRGETPLFSAASGLRREDDGPYGHDGANPIGNISKREDFIYFLLDRGCSVRDSNIYNEQSEEENPDSSNQPPELEQTVLGAAIPHASYKMVSRLIAEGAEVHARQRWWGPTNRIRDSKRVTALHIVSLFWNLEGIHALVDHRGDVSVAEMVSNADDHGRLPLHWALVGDGDERDRGKGKNNQDEIPSRMMNTVKLLLEANPNTINARDHQGATVFNYAVKSDTGIANILSIVKILLDAKPLASTLNYCDPVGATALQDAVDRHYRRRGKLSDGQLTELLEILLANGADARLCLHRLCDGQWMESISPVMIDRLLEVTDINDTDADGCTAMHYLVRHLDQIDAARHLISRGADVNVINHKGNTPLHEVMKGTLLRRLDENGIPDPSQPRDGPVRAREELIKVLKKNFL